ncbi:integrin alpha-6 isoform X1 [Gadus chalcogrammus]|uniref:integrin alpha-6 isoform X1 n=1 Tax=Gadus chalcogrammus TaxID=1042646 RepID=UPI0024C49C2E|nr:integrin alpha-6 isoform X1 [Gadus chalcogrammus]
MERRGRLVALYVAFTSFWLQLPGALAFNLDVHNVIRKQGEPGSLFGFSLAMHRQLNPDKRMLLIGAPRARALGNQRANITGGLYKCELTLALQDCERIQFDDEEDVRTENKENQWMGVTVQSQGPGGKIVTCAHRYQRRLNVNTLQESRDITGRCYMLSQDLSIDTTNDEDGGNWKFCEGRARGHERFGSCQQGLAATFTKDYHYVVFGAPGAYNWKGIVRMEQKNNTLLEMGIYDDGPFEVGDENLLDPDLVPVPANSYLGFSLDSGHTLTRGPGVTIVAGAPRAHHSGAVVLLRKESEGSTRLSPEFILQGPGLASSFGYDVTVVDLNGDGWQDIVVGAPQFFLKDGDVGGAAYVYINQAGRWDRVTPVRLNGTKDSMFGLAVENIGDMNQDSYQDIAVGAPHDDAGVGKVYIFHGAAHGVNPKAAQILSGKPNDIQLFGYSLAGNMDLDGNSYPDLAVGSLSDTALIFRARPVVSIKTDLKITPKEIDFSKKTCGNNVCFTIEACFTYKANPATYSPKLTISFAIEAEGYRRKQGLLSRVVFLDRSPSDQDHQSSGTLDLRGQNKKNCFKAKVKLQENIKDKLRGIPVEVSVGVVGTKRHKRQHELPALVPIVDPSQPSRVAAELNFLKEGCGRDNICQSNLQLHFKFCSKENNQEVFTPLPIENGTPVFSMSEQKTDLALQVTVKNRNGDDAHEAKLVGSFPESLSYSGFRSHNPTREKQVICIANQNGSQSECDLGNPLKRDSEATFYIILSTAGISFDTTEISIDLLLQTTSTQEGIAKVSAKAKVVIELALSVAGVARPSQVYFGGVVKGESAVKTEEEIGSLINYEFRITNLGKPLKSFGSASLNIQWPKENFDGKWLLYLVKITSTGLAEVPCTPETEINALDHIQESSESRTKRSTGESPGGQISLLLDQRKRKVLMCGNGYDARCVVIKCPLQGLDSTAVISLRSRLWNSTFLENYASLNYLDIIVKASLKLDSPAKNMILRDADTQVRVTVFPEKAVAQYGGVPWWIILVSVLAGILMLSLLVFLLWKCGFFRRAKPEESVPKYHAVRIRRESLPCPEGKVKLEFYERKPWMTIWSENEGYS